MFTGKLLVSYVAIPITVVPVKQLKVIYKWRSIAKSSSKVWVYTLLYTL